MWPIPAHHYQRSIVGTSLRLIPLEAGLHLRRVYEKGVWVYVCGGMIVDTHTCARTRLYSAEVCRRTIKVTILLDVSRICTV